MIGRSFNCSAALGLNFIEAFATAGNIIASSGPILGIPFLLLAGITAYSRIQQRAHFAGDVIFGATLGYTMGSGFYKHHENGRLADLNIMPYFEDRGNYGLVARYIF